MIAQGWQGLRGYIQGEIERDVEGRSREIDGRSRGTRDDILKYLVDLVGVHEIAHFGEVVPRLKLSHFTNLPSSSFTTELA